MTPVVGPTILLAFYAAVVLLAFVLPVWRVWRATGTNPIVLPRNDDVESFVGRMFKLLVALLGAYLVARAAGALAAVGAIVLPWPEARAVVAMALLGASLVWTVVAQWNMGRSWRIGIDSRQRTELACSGLFRISRNPIFLGMLVQLTGLFLGMPEAITLLVLVAGFILISVQIRLEEAHLLAQHGRPYSEYQARVRRWL